jgi:hypothetical protein
MPTTKHSDKKTVIEHFAVYILYFLWHVGHDRTKYKLDLKAVCDVCYTCDEYGIPEITNWKLPFMPPTFKQLRAYTLQAVLRWYTLTYELPAQIVSSLQHLPQITSEDMMGIYTGDFVHAATIAIVFNVTHNRLFYFNRHEHTWKPVA